MSLYPLTQMDRSRVDGESTIHQPQVVTVMSTERPTPVVVVEERNDGSVSVTVGPSVRIES